MNMIKETNRAVWFISRRRSSCYIQAKYQNRMRIQAKSELLVNYFLASEVLLGNLRIDHMNQNLKM